MPIETLDDIIEELMNKLGIYGAHDENESKICRCCASTNLRNRIEKAVKIEKKIKEIENENR